MDGRRPTPPPEAFSRKPRHARWALFFDPSNPIAEEVKAAWLADSGSWSRRSLYPLVRLLARSAMIPVRILRWMLPDSVHSARLFQEFAYRTMTHLLSPEAGWLILRHANAEAEILAFLQDNIPGIEFDRELERATTVEDVRTYNAPRHTLDVFEFIRSVGRRRGGGGAISKPASLDFSSVSEGMFSIEELPRRWSSFLDLGSGLEIAAPFLHLLIPPEMLEAAYNSLPLDEPVAIYLSRILGDSTHLSLLPRRYSLTPVDAAEAVTGFYLHLYYIELLHGLLVRARSEHRPNDGSSGMEGGRTDGPSLNKAGSNNESPPSDNAARR